MKGLEGLTYMQLLSLDKAIVSQILYNSNYHMECYLLEFQSRVRNEIVKRELNIK